MSLQSNSKSSLCCCQLSSQCRLWVPPPTSSPPESPPLLIGSWCSLHPPPPVPRIHLFLYYSQLHCLLKYDDVTMESHHSKDFNVFLLCTWRFRCWFRTSSLCFNTQWHQHLLVFNKEPLWSGVGGKRQMIKRSGTSPEPAHFGWKGLVKSLLIEVKCNPSPEDLELCSVEK